MSHSNLKTLRCVFYAIALSFWMGCGTPDPTEGLPSAVIWVAPQGKPDGKVVFAKLQDAINAAQGRLIRVQAGTYPESLVVPAGARIQIEAQPDQPFILIPPKNKPGWNIAEKAWVAIRYMKIEGGLRGFSVAAGAKLTLEEASINNTVGQAISAKGSEISVKNVSIKGVSEAPKEKFKQIGQAQGIRVEAGTLHVTDCTFVDTSNRGVNALKGTVATIKNSTFTGGKFTIAAIAFQEAQGIVQNVDIKDWKEGVFINKSSVTVENSSIENSKGNAFLVSEGSRILLLSNTIKAPKKSGISTSNSGGKIAKNTITNAGDFGIYVFQTLPTEQMFIEKNNVTQAKASGIQIFGARATVFDNKVIASQRSSAGDDGYGIAALDTDDVRIIQNEVKDSAGSGVYLLRSTGVVGQNKIEGNKESGIFIAESPANLSVTLVQNKVSRNYITGILTLKSTVKLEENQVSQTIFVPSEKSGSGVVAFGGSKVTILKDTYSQNEQHGLLVAQNSQVKVSQSTFSENKSFGVFLDCATSKLQDDANSYKGNAQGDKNKCP